MKCSKCGANLQDGVRFCRECGTKVDNKIKFCRECGAELHAGAKFCINCGRRVNIPSEIKEDRNSTQRMQATLDIPRRFESQDNTDIKIPQSTNRIETEKKVSGIEDSIKAKSITGLNSLDLFCKIIVVAAVVVVLLLIIAILAHKFFAIVFSVLQIAGLTVALLMHKEIIKTPKQYPKYIVLAAAVVFTILNIMSYSWGVKTQDELVPPETYDAVENTPEEIDWKNITLANILPEPQSKLMDVIYNGEDWLNVNIYNLSEYDFLEYVRWCKEDYGFTVDSDSFDSYFYAYNKEGYCVTLFYEKTSKELSINLDVPIGFTTEEPEEQQEHAVETEPAEQTEPHEQTETGESAYSIRKGTEYAYMIDEWNVYIATAVSDNIIKIENWNKNMSNAKSVSYEYDVGAFKINDLEHEFAWVDEEHTAFVITFKDKNNSRFKKGAAATFTINISDSDKNKGSNYSEEIACYSTQNDDWHLYRAIPLTDTLIKIECWYRGNALGTFLFGYDVALIDTANGNTDFEWTDNEHTAFSITMKDEQNESYWKKETFVVFELENEGYTHSNVASYLSSWEVGEGEAAVPTDASEFKFDNYLDVKKSLEGAGFTNIKTEILYDIVLGWTTEGEVDSVTIGGKKDFSKGMVFSKDVEIIITYHMWEDDDPERIKMTKKASDYEGKNYSEVQKAIKDLGFTNVVLEETETTDTSYDDGEVYRITIDYEHFNVGDAYRPGDKVLIKYYSVKKVATESTTKAPETTPNITVENNADFAALMGITDQTDATTIQKYVRLLKGKVIEFDGCVVFMMQHGSYKTRFDVCLANGDYSGRVYGPLFGYEDVNFYDMHVSGADTVAQGMLFRIEAKVVGFNSEGGYVILEPVSMIAR